MGLEIKMYEYDIVKSMKEGEGLREIETGAIQINFDTYKLRISIEDGWLKIYKTDCPAVNSILIKPEVSNVIHIK